MGETKVRYGAVRVADKTDDQKTAFAILNALASSVTQEDLQEFVLSQIKRIIHGSNPGTWRDDFVGSEIPSLEDLADFAHFAGIEVLAICQTTDAVGDIVCISGDSIGDRIQVTKIDIFDYSKMPGVGVLVSKTSPTECRILRYGLLNVTGLVPGKTYFAGADGTLTLVRPVALPGRKAFVQVVGVAMDANRLILNPSFNLTRTIT